MISVRKGREVRGGGGREGEEYHVHTYWWPGVVMGTCTQPVGWSLGKGSLA